MSELAKIVQEQRLENKKLEKIFLASKKKSLQLIFTLNQKQYSTPVDPWDFFLTTEVTGSDYTVAGGKLFGIFRIYADVKKFLMEVNGMVGILFKVCESFSEAHLYLEDPFTKETDGPIFLGTDLRGSPSPPTRGGVAPPTKHPEVKRSDLLKTSMLDLGGSSVTGGQSKGKEGNTFGYSVLDMVKLRNGLVPDPDRLPEVMKKHFTEQMADFVTCPWSEGRGGDLDGEHTDIFTHALTTLVGKQNDEAFGVNTMHTQWKQSNRITLGSIKTLEDLTILLEDLRDSETALSQNVGTNLDSVILKARYDDDIARE
jgi:hypothetical protein